MATEIAKAYVQIIPTTKGIKGELSSVMGGEGSSAGETAGQSFASKFATIAKSAIAALGIGKAISGIIDAYADYEQLSGGVKKLFGDASDELMKFADQAYQTAGISANDYMENVTSFSAALINSLGGDTHEAVGYANQAMMDMADNANTFGTDIESIQNAYQGFAKQNFTMLDNLKLGYGGTKTEMERLLRDAEQLEGFMEGSLSVDNFADIVTAIGIIQEQTGITGTTAKEAADTYSGSLNAMKAAFENFQTSLGSGVNIEQSLSNLVSTVINYLQNNLFPMLTEILGNLPTTVLEGVVAIAPTLIQAATDTISTIASGLMDNAPMLVETALGLIETLGNGLIEALPTLVDAVPPIIEGIVSKFTEMNSSIIEVGTKLLVSIVENLPEIINQIVAALPQIVESIVNAFIDNIEVISAAGVQLFVALIGSLPEIILPIVGAVPDIMNAIKSAFLNRVGEMQNIGIELFQGLKNGISAMVENIASEVNAWASNFVGGIKSFFGIHSPSTVFAGIGENLMLGLLEGLKEAEPAVEKAMDDINSMTTDSMQSTINLSASGIDSIMRSNATVSYKTDASNISNDIFDGVYRGMINAMHSADFGGNFNIYLEGDKLVSYVTKKQRMAARAMGV